MFLFENKAITLSQSSKTSFNLDLLVDELRTKLVQNERGKPKGLSQLVNYIESFKEYRYKLLDKSAKPEKCTIYPILVVHDTAFNTMGINIFLNRWFKDLLYEKDIQLRIRNLTIIHIDDLLFYSSYLSSLATIIDKYHKYQSNENSPDQMYSLSDFLSFKYKIPEQKLEAINQANIIKYISKFIDE